MANRLSIIQDEVNDSPIEQVRLTVPITDDPTLPALTFRTWVLGSISCAVLAFLNQFFGYRQNALYISSVSAQIVVLPIGRLMAATLPKKPIRIPATKWSFSLNPGPFNLKEHVLITIFANSGSNPVYAVGIITIVKAFYHRRFNPMAALLLTQTTQLLGYGWAGLFRKFLVDSPYMWWPANLVQVSLFRALHEIEVRPKGGLTRLQFFLIVLMSSFAYYVVPNYLFPSITAISFVCWIWKKSITAQQIGAGLGGLGIGSFGLDWSTVAGFLGSPLATPGFAIINIMAGFVLFLYVIIPIAYWTNLYEAKRFPIYSPHVFDAYGGKYNVSLVLNDTTFGFDHKGYDAYSKVHLSIIFVFAYGLSFATLAATMSHVALFHGRKIWQQTKATFQDQYGDVHTRLMKKNYESVPQWWFHVILAVVIALAIFTCEGFSRQLQLPYWGVMLAICLAMFFTLPIGVIQATTNQQPGLNVVTELIIGYMYPGKPLANVAFKTYGYISMSQAVTFLSDFKLGHYMKVPPKSMFLVQLVGTLIASSVYFSTAWWLLETVENICDPSKLPDGSPWTCPGDDVFYNASIIWGVVGPRRMFGPLGLYGKMNYFFLIGAVAPVPVWLLSRKFPDQKWISLINMPIILGATGYMPPARAVNYLMWGAVGIFFNIYVYRKFRGWWARHTYVLSAGLDAGVAFMAILCYYTLQIKDINGMKWWGLDLDDHCPLASCPTAPGITVEGCPPISDVKSKYRYLDWGKNYNNGMLVRSWEEVDDSPIEQVRLTVPITDDPTLPALTFRTWVLGLTSCVLLAFLNQFFGYRQNPLYISSVCAQIVVLPIGKLMASTFPSKPIRVPIINWSFSLNPGPFNLKEHVLITIFANSGSNGVYALNIITIVKAFYHKNLHPVAAILLTQTTQMLGYGWAGLFRKYLVDSPFMWWPSNLVQVSLFRALHEVEVRPKGGLTRLQFFLMVLVASFSYYIVPNYFFPSITALSFVCWIWKESVTAQQIGSGLHGMGIGSFAFDWATVSSFLGSPLATPGFAVINLLAGFSLTLYVLIPIAYWTNAFEAKRFPFFSSHVFDVDGQAYNISRVLNDKTFQFERPGYDGYSKIHLSIFFAYTYGLSFATLTATISHVALFHGKSIWRMWKQTKAMVQDQIGDVHTRIMKKNYEAVPQWWFHIILILMVALSLYACEGFNNQLQLPWWGILLACALALFFTLPIGVITATTNQQPGLNVLTELVIGYLYPGKPLANVAFKTYGYISMTQAINFLGDFKLGHYMKIPPKSMFVAQLVGTVVASSVYFGTAWWLLTTVENICDTKLLPEGSPWTCPGDDVFYNASIIWGVVGPLRMFGRLGVYSKMNWFFLIGLLAPVPVWLLSLKFPEKKWIRLINMPIIFGATMNMPPARAVNYLAWGALGIFFNFYVYRKYKGWWAKHNYILSAAMDAGIAFMAILAYFSLQMKDINGVTWWGLDMDDHCPLATCPTAPGIVVDGCPVH
ncbi:hypothetical protein HHK36_005840 [Tetracentron sinense]|uniref:Oligopeptide transporter n=1 Tax=Tetracentron sinense TaxID=13715 RepID=A0A834ZV33_TETSI|nr:hypothetical protein HHK36_005840 [Tetracentron sinense]